MIPLFTSSFVGKTDSFAIPQSLQVFGDGGIKPCGLGLLFSQLRNKPLHLLVEWLTIIFLRFGPYVSAGGEYMTVFADLIQRNTFAEAGVSSYSPASFSPRHAWYVPAMRAMSSRVSSRWVRSTMLPILRASINKTSPSAVAEFMVLAVSRQEPEADRYLCGVKELARHGYHAVDQIGLDNVLADLSLARLVGTHRSVCEHKTRDA